jgi:uncharacterized lipoprotein YajG
MAMRLLAICVILAAGAVLPGCQSGTSSQFYQRPCTSKAADAGMCGSFNSIPTIGPYGLN